MLILPKIQEKIQTQIMPLVKPKWEPMFNLGINALSFKPFVSLNSNARTSRENEKAAEMQIYRLTNKRAMTNIFSSVLISQFKIDEKTEINIDFSIFHPFAMLCFSIQTREGRSIPVWFDIISYPVEKDSQNIFILDSLREFLAVIGCCPKIVCDRGFIGQQLIHGFLDLNLIFYVRMKAGKKILVKEKLKTLSKQWSLDQTGIMYGEKIRVVRSSKTLQRKLNVKEPWYIITNDFKSSRKTILETYYYRFEIEETFKDLKHLFNCSQKYLSKISTLKMILWFQILGIWLLWKFSRKLFIKRQTIKQHLKKKLSWIRQVFEQLTRETNLLVLPEANRSFNTPCFAYKKEVISP